MVIDAETNESIEFYAKIVFVNGSTLGSTFILLNSTSEAHLTVKMQSNGS
jgi:hypothetical protein